MPDVTRSHDTLMGLEVRDDESYARYRAGMTPILERYGGAFRHDFRIAEVLKTEIPHAINRVFVISFPTAERREAFFRDEAYLDVRRAFFEPAVANATAIATYQSEARRG